MQRKLEKALRCPIMAGGALMVLLTAASAALAQTAAPDPARLWQAYASRYISGDGRVVDPQGGDRTTSEGQSYALFFALVNNDRGRFDQLLRWTTNNMAQGDLGEHLPAWSWGKAKDGHWGVLDQNSASDSDLWIAYDLVEAGRLWSDHDYTSLGRRLADLIGRKETASLPGLGEVLLPGPVGFHLQHLWVLNPSYSPLFLLERLAEVSPAGPWAGLAKDWPTIQGQSARNGFAMDWVCYGPDQGFSPCLANGAKAATGKSPGPMGSYDAIRVYLWTGMLADSVPAKAQMMHALAGMNEYMQQHSAPPEKINASGVPMNQDGPVGFSAALLPYLASFSNEGSVAQQLVRIQSQLDEKSNLYGSGYGGSPAYYDQNLVLFGSGWYSKQFQFGRGGELLVRWGH